MNLSPYEIALIAGGFTIIGVLLGAWIGYRNALKIHNIVEFNKAAADFRNAFLPEISYLEHDIPLKKTASTDQSIKWFLRTGLPRHTEALCVFKAYLSNDERSSIDKAWNKYRTQSDSYDSKPMLDEEKKAALEKIHGILNKFASLR